MSEVRARPQIGDKHINQVKRDLYDCMAMIEELSCDLGCEVNYRYGSDIHPAMQRKYDNDIDVVNRANNLVLKLKSEYK